MSFLHSSAYLFDARPDYPLLVSVKQYYDPATRCTDPDALTLVFAHAATHVKEIWEPCIEELFGLAKAKGLKVNDAWSIESPNHGEAAAMNAKILEWCYRPTFRTEDLARGIHAILTNAGIGIDVDFSKRRLVAIGHSMGGLGMMQTTIYKPCIPWEAMFLVEAMLVPPLPFAVEAQANLVASVDKQPDTWASLEEARRGMLRSYFRAWDKRAFGAFIKHGLRPVDIENPEGPVTLKNSKSDAVACYGDPHGLRRCYLYLADLAKRVPTHLIFGAVPDVFGVLPRDDMINVASGGRDKLASVTLIQGAGHLVTVTHPKELATALFDSLQQASASSSTPGAKL